MRLGPLGWFLVAGVLPTSSPAQAKPKFDSRYDSPTQCKNVKFPPEDRDWVYVRCRGLGGIPIWYVCVDSARCKLGVGTKPNVSGMFAAASFTDWPIEWRGRFQGNGFKAFALIMRGRSWDPDDPKTTLTVYRLRADGTSCVIGEAATNEAARAIADGATGSYRCESEPELELP